MPHPLHSPIINSIFRENEVNTPTKIRNGVWIDLILLSSNIKLFFHLNFTRMSKRLTLIACLALLGGTLTGSRAATPPGNAGAPRSGSPQKVASAALPYYNDFNERESTLDGWTFVNTNPNFTWFWSEYSGFESTPCLSMSQRNPKGEDTPSDNWVFTPAFELQEGLTYKLQFYLYNWYPSDLDVRLTTGTDISNPGTLLFHYEGEDWGDKSVIFEVPSTGIYHLAFYDKSPYTANQTSLRYQVYIDNLSLMAVSNNAVPEPVGSLTQIPGADGEISMSLEWFNPTLSKKGEELDGLTEVQISKDGELVETLRDNIIPGVKMTWTDPEPTTGVHTYKVAVLNSTGESDPAVVSTFIGIDDPGAPQNLVMDYDADAGIITLDWEEPTFGRRGGWFDKTGISYRLVRQPGNKLLANNLTEAYFEDDNLDEYGNYVYEVTTRTNASLGGTATTNGVVAGSHASLPIREGWEDKNTYPTWEIADNNGDGHTLGVRHAFGHNSNSAIGWDYLTTEVTVDESLYSAPVRLEKGKKYRASLWMISNIYGSFSYDFTYGKSKTRAAQNNIILSYSDVSTGGVYAQESKEFSVSETGTYYFSLWVHDCSHHLLWFDDIRIEEVFDKNIEATSIRNLNNAPTAGDKITTGVTYSNCGTSRASSIKVQLIDNDNNVLGEQNISRALSAGNTGTANIEWTVPDATGRFAVRGRVVMEGDKCEADNTTSPYYIDIVEKGKRAVNIGTGSDFGKAPFDYYAFNFSETIYPAEAFGNLAGEIYSMAFKVQLGMENDFPGVPFRVYLCHTTEKDLFKGWIPADYQMTKVFDGTLDLMRGMTEVVIPFDTPFSYNGGNLCVLVEGRHDPTLMLNNGYGMNNYVTEAAFGTTRFWDLNSVRPDAADPDQTVGRYYPFRPNATFYIDHSVTASIKGTITDIDGNPVAGATVCDSYSSPTLKAETDAEGKYEIPYFPVGWGMASLEVNKKGYETGYLYGDLASGETSIIDFNEMKKCSLVTVKGKVTSAIDNVSPIAGAKITAIGDNELHATTDADGMFELKDAYAFKEYPVFTIEADGYKPVSWPNKQFYDDDASGIAESDAILNPITASPFSVTAFDRGDKAEIKWEEPVEDITITKANDDIAGMFGGAGTLSVAHRYSPEDLKALGIGENLLLKAIRFVPMCYAQLSVAVWQGTEGHETPVYLEDVTPSAFKEWNTFTLSNPCKIDPSQSLLIGMKIVSTSGSYPIGLDHGPLADGGDVILDGVMNEWITAHEAMQGDMDYNWAIQGVFGNNPNSGEVPWISKREESPAKVARRHNVNTDLDAYLNAKVNKPEEKAEALDLSKADIKLLDTPLHAPSAKSAGLSHEIKGYNIYRFEPGDEEWYMWAGEKVNSEPVIGTSFTDESWGAIEDKPYRYAVVSYYGNPYEWGDGVTSDPTFSDGVDKGRYSSVTVNVTSDNGSPDGAKVYIVGDGKSVMKTVEEGKNAVIFDDVRFTDYEIKAIKPYFHLYTSPISVDTKATAHEVKLEFSAPVVPNLQATDYINEARLAWTEPSPAVGMDIHTTVSGPGMELIGYHMGEETIAGYRVTPEARAGLDYTDFYFDEISFYANAPTTYYPVVWRHNIEPERPWGQDEWEEEHEIYRQRYDVSPNEVGTWVTVKLDEPVKINPKDTYYVGYAATNTNTDTPLILDDAGKDSEGAWYYGFDQRRERYCWINLDADACWMVKAHITDTPDKENIKKEAVKYDLYRLASADVENEKNWKKVNSDPIEADSYNDSSWKDEAAADYRYAVKAIYKGDTTSDATFSKELPKGKVALVGIDLTANNGLSAAGAKATLTQGGDIYRAEAKADGKVEIPEVKKNGNYNLTIALPGYEEISEKAAISQDIVSLKYELSEIKEAPIYLDAVASADNSKVDLTWREPGQYAPAEGWVHWDDGKPYAGFGTSTGFCAVAQAFLPEDLESMRMKEYDITKISFFPTDYPDTPTSRNASWVAKIWRIDMTAGVVEEVATGDAENVVFNQWNEILFDTPYHINGDEALLIGYEFYGEGNALGIDQGPCQQGHGDWANFGDGWLTLSSAVSDYDFNNLIHVYVENLGKRDQRKVELKKAAQPILRDIKKDVKMSKVKARDAQKADHPQLASGVNYPYKGFRVYRLNASDRDNESAWTELTAEPVKDTQFSDNTWKNVGKGTYLWAVKAVYATGNSAPEFSLEALDETGKVSSVEDIVSDGIRIERISRDKLLVEVPADAEINMVDAAGLTILAANIKSGENIIDINIPDGIYMIRVAMDGNSRSLKLMLK